MSTSPVKPAVLTMMRPRPTLRQKLEARYELIGPLSKSELEAPSIPRAAHIQAVLTIGRFGCSRRIIETLPRLGLICCYGAGIENIDLEAAAERDIKVTNGRGANASCVADTALALLLSVVLKVITADKYVRSGAWDALPPRNWTAQPGLGGKRLGILGLGEIGLRIAQRALAFELEVGYCNRSQRSDVPYAYFGDVQALARWCDFLVIAAPASKDTRALVDAAALKALGPAGYLINIGRGSVVDEAALIQALQSSRIAGAGLDVFAREPTVPQELQALPNVVLMPHLGGVSDRAYAAMDELALDNLAAFFAGKPLINQL